MLWRDTKFTQIIRQFCNFRCWIHWWSCENPIISFVRNEFVSRKNWHWNVWGDLKSDLKCYFMHFRTFDIGCCFSSSNLSCSLARKNLWGVLIWFNMISTRNWILQCQSEWFKYDALANPAFWASSEQMVW